MKYIALLFSLIYSIQGIASPQSIEGKIVFTDGTPVKNTLLHLEHLLSIALLGISIFLDGYYFSNSISCVWWI